ncbi:hypothetical protein [Kitasatospora sp. NPDC088351]|uniref:hypothetical protein n=1 Tax=unclassified Kitasatospora TaxID=2633591 RepID=UPI00344725FC
MAGQTTAGEPGGAAVLGTPADALVETLSLAAVAEAIEDTVQRGLGVSHAWDTADLVLPVRAVVDLKGRVAELTALVAERLADAHQEAGDAVLSAW